jgi:hypothetical protein
MLLRGVCCCVECFQYSIPVFCGTHILLQVVVVYSNGQIGNVTALNADTGAFLWNAVTDGNIQGAPVAIGNFVFVGSLAGDLVSYDVNYQGASSAATPPWLRAARSSDKFVVGESFSIFDAETSYCLRDFVTFIMQTVPSEHHSTNLTTTLPRFVQALFPLCFAVPDFLRRSESLFAGGIRNSKRNNLGAQCKLLLQLPVDINARRNSCVGVCASLRQLLFWWSRSCRLVPVLIPKVDEEARGLDETAPAEPSRRSVAKTVTSFTHKVWLLESAARAFFNKTNSCPACAILLRGMEHERTENSPLGAPQPHAWALKTRAHAISLGRHHLACFDVGDEFCLKKSHGEQHERLRGMTIGSPSPPECPAIFLPVPAAEGAA